ncbi:MAG: hypothetical protein AAGK10_09265, partial [Cyanobacteria bacterium J06555_3]
LEEKVDKLVEAIEHLKTEVDIPLSIKEAMPGKDAEFYDRVETLAEQAFDDQCTGSNPRYPLIKDLQELYALAYQGNQVEEKILLQKLEMSL